MSSSGRETILTRFSEEDVLPSELELGVLLRSFAREGASVEDNRVDLKVSFANDARAWPHLLKDLVALHNSGGGVLIIGVSNGGTRAGLSGSLSAPLDPTNVGNKARRYHLNGSLRTAYLELTSYRKRFGFLFVYCGAGLITFDKDVSVDRSGLPPEIVARAGTIYVRRDSATNSARQGDLDAMLSRVLGRGVRAFLARVEKVATLPASAQLIAQTPGSVGGYVLTAAGQGVPVKVVGPEAGAEAIALTEALLPDLPLASIDAEIVGQLRQFNSDPEHRVQQATLRRWYLSRTAASLPDGAARFMVRSALDTRGLPCYWAATMDREDLRKLVVEVIRLDRYPARDAVPYLVAGFFWQQRADLLRSHSGRPVADRVCHASDREAFLRYGRIGGSAVNIRIGQRLIAASEMFSDVEFARSQFDDLLADESLYRSFKQVANQLDLWLHADRSS